MYEKNVSFFLIFSIFFNLSKKCELSFDTKILKVQKSQKLGQGSFNPLNQMGRNTGSRECVPLTRRVGIPSFAQVCQKPKDPLYRLM